MAALANVIVGLDGLSPSELETVAMVCALRGGKVPSSPQVSVDPTDRLTAGWSSLSLREKPMAASKVTFGATAADFVDNPEFRKLIKAVSACSAVQVYGAGRKLDMLNRVSSVTSAWHNVPERIKRLFRDSSSQKKPAKKTPQSESSGDEGTSQAQELGETSGTEAKRSVPSHDSE
jgi:hypothetical protein